MSISKPSQGTHFSDGVRTGPIVGSHFVPGANVLTPSVLVPSPFDQQPPGVFNTPMSLLDIIPAPVNATALAAAQTPGAAGYLTLQTVSNQNISVITYQSIQNVIQLDSARNITITGSVGSSLSQFTVFGWDTYGQPVVEQIAGPVGAVTVKGNKAFMYIQAIYSSAGTVANISVGVGNTFGLGHLITNPNYVFVPMWNGAADSVTPGSLATIGTLAANPITTANTSGLVTVSVAGASAGPVTTAGLVVGQWITIAGAATTNGITAAQLNITAQIVSIPSNTTFTYFTLGVATSSGAGGGAAVTLEVTNTVVTADQHLATATTGDVRGTYTPSSSANGFNRLTINYYSASGDGRVYNKANSGTIILGNNPITTTNGVAAVGVYAPNHQLVGPVLSPQGQIINGQNVTISGATTTNGITAGQLNITAPVTIVDANNFTFVSTGVATSSGQGGGAAVTMTPMVGELYSSTVGRYGVSQYSVALF